MPTWDHYILCMGEGAATTGSGDNNCRHLDNNCLRLLLVTTTYSVESTSNILWVVGRAYPHLGSRDALVGVKRERIPRVAVEIAYVTVKPSVCRVVVASGAFVRILQFICME